MYNSFFTSCRDFCTPKCRQGIYLSYGSKPGIHLRRLFGFCAVGLFLFLTVSPVHAALAEAVPLIRNYTAEEIGTTAKVRCLLESTDGILYAGADRLLVFDGAVWANHKIENTPEILSLCQEGDRIWAGGLNEAGFFEKKADGGYAYTSVTSRIGDRFYGAIHRIFVVGGNLILVTERKVVQLPINKGPARIWELPSDPKLKAYLYHGVVYINQTAAGEVKTWALRNDTLEPDQSLFGSDARYRTPIGLIGEYLVLGSGRDLYAKNTISGAERKFYADAGELNKAKLTGGILCKESTVYISTLSGGIFVIDLDGGFAQITRATGLASDACTALADSDQTKGLWAVTDEGISFIHADLRDSWLGVPGSVHNIFGDQHDLLVSHGQGSFRFTAGEKIEFSNMPFSRWASVGSVLYAVSDGKLYKSTTGALGFSEWNRVDGVYISSILGVKNKGKFIYAGAITSSAARGLVRLDVDTGRSTMIEMPEGIACYLQDKAGKIWVTTLAGSVMMLDEELQKGTLHQSSRKRSLLTLHEGDPVLLYADAGFLTMKGDNIRGGENVSGAAGTESVEGPAWIYGRVNDAWRVGMLGRVGAELTWQRKNIPGLKRFKTISAIYASGDDLWIGGDNGVIQVDVAHLEGPDFSIPEGAEINVRNLAQKTLRVLPAKSRTFQLANGEQEISVKLKTHVWGLLEPPEYESRLYPLEDEWTQHKYGETIVHKNLPTGEYTLQLRVRHLGEVGPVTEYKVVRQQPWYFSYLGITFFALVGSLIFYGLLKLRTGRIMAHNRELELKIVDRTKELAKANAAKSEFLAAMSHEIRNPMNGVIGIVKILQEAKLGSREKYYLTTLHRCAEQLRTTVDDVLDFTKIEAGTITLHPDTFDLAESISATITAVDLAGNRLELTSWAGPRPTVSGDQGKFTQILTNYFTNALKYGIPSAATIDVFVLNEGAQRCRITLAVTNSGPDLPVHEQATLFDSFTRGEFAKRGRIGGSGLGLSICKKFAEAMGGSVGVKSANGSTVFQITVPFDIVLVSRVSADDLVAPRQLNARALAIEDEDYNRLVLGNILNQLGYTVDWACDGKSALILARQNGYDLILTDLMLPDTDGRTLTKELLALCEEPKPPVFAVTAYSTKEKEDECLNAGMAGFISKPITVEKLEASLNHWADRHRAGTRKMIDLAEVGAARITLQQLARLGPLETMLPDYIIKIESEWASVDRMLEDRECTAAANTAHRMMSALFVVEAGGACDQLRILESRLRDGALESEIEKVRSVCRDEIDAVVKSLKAALKRHLRINEAQSPM